ncbi:MAG: HEAT repeat domain-containing protein [Chloroflexota bacterium]|nr:HEAT repeat domain-containing protein [Chloroflexota bacterium]
MNDKERENALRAEILYLLSDLPVPSSAFSYALQDAQPDVCIAAIRALMQRKEYGSVPELLTIVATPTIPYRVRRTALEAVGYLGTKAHTQQVIPYLNEADLRLTAVQVVGQLRDPAATEALLSFIRELLPTFEQHEDPRQRSFRRSFLRASIESLVKIDPLEDIHIFKEIWLWAGRTLLSPGERTDIQKAIIKVLRSISNQEATPFLMALHQEASPGLRVDIILALTYRGASISLPLLVEALWDEDTDVRARLAKMWKAMKFPLIQQILQEELHRERDVELEQGAPAPEYEG